MAQPGLVSSSGPISYGQGVEPHAVYQQGLGACLLNCRCPSWLERTGRAGEGVQGVGGILLLTMSV